METFEEITDKGNMVSIVKDGETFTFTRDHLKGEHATTTPFRVGD